MNDTITKDQVLNAYNSAPDIVRAAFNDEATTKIIVDLQTRLQLHIDSAGVLGKEVGYLLLGLTDPSKFVSRLKGNNFQEQIIDEIVAEINQKIFIPLREQMRSGAGNTQQPAKPVPPQASVPPIPRPVQAQVPSYAYAQPKQSSPQPTPPKPAQPVVQAVPQPVQPRPVQQQIAPVQNVPQMSPPRSVNIGRLLEDHEEPHIDIAEKISRSHLDNDVPPNLPGTMISPAIPEVRPSPKIPKVEPLKPSAPARPYSTDPYREPLDEK